MGMTGLVRAGVKAPSGVVRLFVLCQGCLHELIGLTDLAAARRWVKPFGIGDGQCELCQLEIQKIAQSD
jgi:hypothetical protein